ncbi:RNA-directed DNA polymerase, eukaryota [Tanacetum coccineum]
MYKIIAKILANQLVRVLGDLVNEVQSTFIANRQILDGPFILDELIHWCKSKKKETMIFKVDFEKAYDSVRWDYLDDVLNKFGFGSKWRDWILNCLHSFKGSILVNGSPTGEFQFQKCLKQGDPLSPFLFLLIMESLHLSFQNVVNEGLFKRVSVSSSLHLSHLFYADDVIFMGKWSKSNINTIVQALDCFYKASGLRMNLHKSKLMGIAVDDELVSRAAIKMGCSTMKTHFLYLGIKVGGLMSRIRSWDGIMDKLRSRLSRWKMKTLSIRGRLTLLNFSIGADPKENKKSWFKWSRVLASKDKGGLGVSSFFALNKALLFKWIWRFHNDRNSLWSRFMRALHGNGGGKREHEEMEIFIKEFRTTNELLLKTQSNLLSELKIKVNELSKVVSNVLIPKNEVKGVTTREGKMTSEATRNKEINETRINKNKPPRFEQDVQEKPQMMVRKINLQVFVKGLLNHW